MKLSIRTITYTAMLLALLICLQWLGSQILEPLVKQLITGSFVNCVLAVAALTVGLTGGIVIALVSPVMAFLLNIAPNIVTVVPIMVANTCFVVLIRLIAGKQTQFHWRKPVAVVAAATVKFVILYALVVKVICQIAAPDLLGQKIGDTVLLAPPMLLPDKLPLMFAWPQLVTALVGGTVAMLIVPVLRKSLQK